jgi:hypothetical protein
MCRRPQLKTFCPTRERDIMTKTIIGWSLLVTIFVFGAIVPLVLITLVGFGVGAAILRGGRHLSSRRHTDRAVKA